MTHLRTVPPEEAVGRVKEIYESELSEDGYVSNKTRLFSLHPDAYLAWFELIRTIRGRMDLRRYELVTLAAARALRCRYCVGAHAGILESTFLSPAQVAALVRDYRSAGLPAVDVAIMALAEKVALEAYRVTPSDIAGLRRYGLGEAEIFDVALAAAARCFFSKVLDGMGAEPDEEHVERARLLELVELPPAIGC